jgi:DNA replication licensing factor MCM6
MTEEAREYLVGQYISLRQADASGVGRASYRITVRQLESMIRLSEALAKLHGMEEVLLRHVTEATYLLKTSIVHIEQEAISLEDEDQDQVMRASEVGQMDEDVQESAMEVEEERPAAPKQSVTLSNEEYQKIVQFVLILLREQEKTGRGEGLKRSAIVHSYMETLVDSDSIVDEEGLIRQGAIVKRVLGRMVKQEGMLIALRDESIEGEETGDDPVLLISPAFDADL